MPIIVAIILNEVVHAQRFFKFVAYFPALVPAVAALLMWQFLLTPGQEGIINSILSQLGIAPLQFLQNPNWTIPLLIMTLTWKIGRLHHDGISGLSSGDQWGAV